MTNQVGVMRYHAGWLTGGLGDHRIKGGLTLRRQPDAKRQEGESGAERDRSGLLAGA